MTTEILTQLYWFTIWLILGLNLGLILGLFIQDKPTSNLHNYGLYGLAFEVWIASILFSLGWIPNLLDFIPLPVVMVVSASIVSLMMLAQQYRFINLFLALKHENKLPEIQAMSDEEATKIISNPINEIVNKVVKKRKRRKKLDPETIAKLQDIWLKGDMTNEKIAEMFGVDPKTVKNYTDGLEKS